MNILSLFDGISCGQVALQRAGIEYENYFASEIDKYAIQITQKNFPDTIQLGDIREIQTKKLPKIDLLIGGPPCQGFSIAGKHLNFKDPRSILFFNFVKILNQIKPTYFLMENVIMKKKWSNIISHYLKSKSIKINSALLSAQNRNRLYWTNILGVEQPKDKKLFLIDIIERKGDNIIDKFNSAIIDTRTFINSRKNVRYLDQKAKCLLSQSSSFATLGATNLRISENTIRTLSVIEQERLQTLPDNYTEGVSKTQRNKVLGQSWTVDVIAHILKEINNWQNQFSKSLEGIFCNGEK